MLVLLVDRGGWMSGDIAADTPAAPCRIQESRFWLRWRQVGGGFQERLKKTSTIAIGGEREGLQDKRFFLRHRSIC
jgi:hypothetical protein